MEKVKIGFVPAHRTVFDEKWAVEMRQRTLRALSKIEGLELVYPDEKLTKKGLVSGEEDAEKTIQLFKEKDVAGIIIGTMTFGDEVAAIKVADSLCDKPVLVFGTKEGPFTAEGGRRSDSFCGTLSVTSGLYRRKISFVFAGIVFPEERSFLQAIANFVRTCAVVNGFKGARIGMVGPRPEGFETVAFNEVAMINRFKQRLVPISLVDILHSAEAASDKDPTIKDVVQEIKARADTSRMKESSIIKIAKLEYALEKYAKEKKLDGMGVQCWTAMQEVYGISSCVSMGRLTDKGIMASCEVDIYGALTMLIQYLASLKMTPPHFIDWTIAHQEEENVFLAWHCGNAPMSLLCEGCKITLREHSILANVVGAERAQGTAEFQLKPGPATICRLAEYDGKFKILITKGNIKKSDQKLRGSWGWVQVDNLDALYRVLVEEGFIHHASLIHGDYVQAIVDSCKFLGIEPIVI